VAAPRLFIHRDFSTVQPAAVIRASLATLFALCDGSLDGDAAFFARRLTFEGDTEAVVALRNSIDDAELQIGAELTAILGGWARPLLQAAGLAQRLGDRLAADMDRVAAALVAPLHDRLDRQQAGLAAMADDIALLKRRLDRHKEKT
jgi:predicted lipid carrier protein YhbT